jgi:hypothetical protein
LYSENGVQVDFDEVNRLVDTADVYVVGFGTFQSRLLVDTRSDATEMPLVRVVKPISSPRARLAWLAKRRPSLDEPRAFTFIPWPHSVGFLADTGIWDTICRSVTADIEPAVQEQCDEAFREMRKLDREATLAILKGENCLTLWPREDEA